MYVIEEYGVITVIPLQSVMLLFFRAIWTRRRERRRFHKQK